MKKFLKNYWVTISFILSFIFDAKYQILEHFISDLFWLNIVKGLGALLLAYFTGNKLANTSKYGDIGGSNPTPIKDEK